MSVYKVSINVNINININIDYKQFINVIGCQYIKLTLTLNLNNCCLYMLISININICMLKLTLIKFIKSSMVSYIEPLMQIRSYWILSSNSIFKFYKPDIFAIWYCRSLKALNKNSVWSNSQSLKYPRFTSSYLIIIQRNRMQCKVSFITKKKPRMRKWKKYVLINKIIDILFILDQTKLSMVPLWIG